MLRNLTKKILDTEISTIIVIATKKSNAMLEIVLTTCMTPRRKIKDSNTNQMDAMMTLSTTITMRKRGLIRLILIRMTNGMPIKTMITMTNIIEILR